MSEQVPSYNPRAEDAESRFRDERRRHLRLQEAVRVRRCHVQWPALDHLIKEVSEPRGEPEAIRLDNDRDRELEQLQKERLALVELLECKYVVEDVAFTMSAALVELDKAKAERDDIQKKYERLEARWEATIAECMSGKCCYAKKE